MRLIGTCLLLLALLGPLAGLAAAACEFPRELKLVADGARGQALLVFAAGKCPVPAACPPDSEPVDSPASRPPLTVRVHRGGETLFSASMADCGAQPCRSINSGGCRSGTDTHKAAAGLIRFAYTSASQAGIAARLRGPAAEMGGDSGAVTVTVTDASAYAVDTVFTTCRHHQRGTTTTMMCR